MTFIQKEVIRCLEERLKELKADNSNITEEEGIEILSTIAHIGLSKEQACSYLNMNKSRFGELMKEGSIPRGRKEKGWKELRWYKDELIKAVNNIRKHF